MISHTPNNGISILNRLIPQKGDALSATAARAFLEIDFEESDRQRMHELSQKARDGSLSPEEKVEIDSYELVGHLIGLLHSKARRSLKIVKGADR